MAWRSLRGLSRLLLVLGGELRVEGREHVPPSGAALIAARHFHHLYDGCALLATVPRPLHLLVALDWARHPLARRGLESACHAAGWPAVLRLDPTRAAPDGERAREASAILRRAVAGSVSLLRAGELLVVFPEGYPNVDPNPTPKTGDDAFLPFEPGFVRIAALAERDGRTRVPIVPAGLVYARGRRWAITLRFGAPVRRDPGQSVAELVRLVEDRVRALSLAAPASSGPFVDPRRRRDAGLKPPR